MKKRAKKNLRTVFIMGMLTMAAYLVLCGFGVVKNLDWKPEWIPAQVCMVIIGAYHIYATVRINGWDE